MHKETKTNFILLLLFMMCILSACSDKLVENKTPIMAGDTDFKEENIFDLSTIEESQNWIEYNDEQFGFSIKYIALWPTTVERTWSGDANQEASPNSGISLYPNGNDKEYIYVFAQKGKISIQLEGYEKIDFVTNYGEVGSFYESIIEGDVNAYLIMDDMHHGAIINMRSETYLENKEKIMSILVTLKVP